VSSPHIKPQTLKGFRDYLPAAMLARERLIDTARRVYRSYGFSPIDTPALEYTEILLGKGGGETEKQMFRFEDQGGRDVAMRFDLTIPFARFAAQHLNDVGTPFKRYHVGTVWRAEKPQKGRFREFMQCDFDTIGTRSNAADIETLLVIHDLFEAIGNEFAIPDFDFRIHVNNRMVLNGLLESLGLQDKSADVLRSLDKLPRIGRDGVQAELADVAGLTAEQAGRVLNATHEVSDGVSIPGEILDRLPAIVGNNETAQAGIDRLREVFAACAKAGLPERRVVLDVSIARGLDYYTGTIYETFLTQLPGIGSVCSGGRYDNLAALYTSQELPGVGASLGLDRLLAALEELGCVPTTATPAEVLITQFDAQFLGDYLAVARELHAAGVCAEVFPEARPLGKQLKYAGKKGFRVAVIAGAEELQSGRWQVKDLTTGDQRSVPREDLPAAIGRMLGT
jgi:histidyl-tRNA synthetase